MNRFFTALTIVVTAFSAVFAAVDPAELITPAPRRIDGNFHKIRLVPGNIKVIFDPEVRSEAAQLGANLYLKEMNRLFKENTETASPDAPQVRIYCGLATSPGTREKLEGKTIRLPEQGYAIRVMQDTPERARIVVAGSDIRGLFYGFATLKQLLTAEDGAVWLNAADIDDHPVWAERYASEDVEWGDFDRYLALAGEKISGFAWQYRADWRNFNASDAVLKNLSSMKKMHDIGLMDFMFLIHVYVTPDEQPKFNISKEEDIQGLIEKCRLVAKYGVGTIMICVDDHTPRRNDTYTFFNPDEAKKFDNSIGKAHGYLMKRLAFALSSEFPKLRLAMVGAPYSLNHGIGKPGVDQYVIDWGKAAPRDVFWVWTGPEVVSPKIEKKDYDAFAKLLSGQDMFVWDNSNCINAPMPRWETEFYPEMVIDSYGILYWNDRILSRSSPWSKPYTYGGNAYLWNPENYNADREYSAALRRIYGEANVAPINRLRNAMVAAQTKIAAGDRAGFKPVMDEFQAAFDACKAVTSPDGKPVIPLDAVADELRIAHEFIDLKVKSQELPWVDGTVKIDGDISDPIWNSAAVLELADRTGKPDAHPSTVRAALNGDMLIFSFDVYNPAELKDISGKERDFPTFLSADNIEIFLQPSPSGAYGHFCFDYAGNQFEEYSSEGGYDWNPDWQVAVRRTADRWTAEAAIPLSEMERLAPDAPSDGAFWRLNIFRTGGEAGSQAWNPGGASYHSPQFFGELTVKPKGK